MKEITAYQCEYCKRMRVTKKAIERHEKECVKNPMSVNCYRCKWAYNDNIYDDRGNPTGRYSAHCELSEEAITERMAHKCENFVRSETTYHSHTGGDFMWPVDV